MGYNPHCNLQNRATLLDALFKSAQEGSRMLECECSYTVRSVSKPPCQTTIMRTILFLIIIAIPCLATACANKQPPLPLNASTQVWGGSGTVKPGHIAATISGSVCVSGYFGGAIDFDPGSGTDIQKSIDANPQQSVFLSYFDPDIKYSWVRSWGPVTFRCPMVSSQSGAIFIGGDFNGTTDFDPDPKAQDTRTSTGNEVYVSKFDSIGTRVWTSCWGGAKNFDLYNCNSIAADSKDNVYVTGDFKLFSDQGPLTKKDAYLYVLDKDGNIKLHFTWGGNGDDSGLQICCDGGNTIYVAGHFEDTIDLNPGTGTDMHTLAGSSGWFLSCFNSDGEYQWGKTWSCSESPKVDYLKLAVNEGSVFVAGNYKGDIDLNPGSSSDQYSGEGAYVFKVDSSGSFQWGKTWNAKVSAMALSNEGTILVTGLFDGPTDFDPGPKAATHRERGSYLSRFSSDGTFQDVLTWPLTTPADISAPSIGDVIVTGSFSPQVGLPPLTTEADCQGFGAYGAFLTKFYLKAD
jgi:hypothetical protein